MRIQKTDHWQFLCASKSLDLEVNPLPQFIHDRAVCTPNQIGEGTFIRADVRISPSACIGQHCCIFEGVTVENDVVIGDRVIIKNQARIFECVVVGDDTFIGNDVVIHGYLSGSEKPQQTKIGRNVYLGDGVEVQANVIIGDFAVIGAGVLVTKSVPDYAILSGASAQVLGNKINPSVDPSLNHLEDHVVSARQTSVKGVTLHDIHKVEDERGKLSMGEFGRNIPFMVSRYFLVYAVPAEEVRGNHAHFKCHQFLIAVNGSISVVADDGVNREKFVLDRADKGLYLPPMTWGVQYEYSEDAVLLVLASDYYDNEDYIRNYDEFIAHITLASRSTGV